ncbi:MAG: molybdopterin-dependent oxidoreductase, partial [Planctomycetota bacterium]
VGVAATTCSYTDWYDADLIVFFGSNPANDQPVSTKYLHEARRRGARVAMVNAYREPGMERYWIPSTPDSALFGTKLTDSWFQVKVGGDLAFLNAVQRRLIERGDLAADFIEQATENFETYRAELFEQPFEALLEIAGIDAQALEAFVDEVARAERAVFVWSMGITQHTHGGDTVRAICNLGLLREAVGRQGTGLMPIRGHSGVQGGAEMGAYATAFPGGVTIDADTARHFSGLWGFDVPSEPGLTTVDALEAAHAGELDAYWLIGGNFLETMPQPKRIEDALASIGLRVHTDLFMTTQMLVEPADVAFILPARTRYEQRGGGTETSTERRVIYSPEIPRNDIGEARGEWELLLDLARAAKPEAYDRVHFEDGAAIRADIERANPAYKGIAALSQQGDQFQWGGPHLCANRAFPTASGKASFRPVRPPQLDLDPEVLRAWPFLIATRRGKQFNSMVQKEVDQLTGAGRDHIFMHPDDATELGLAADAPILLESPHGTYEGRVFLADVARGTLQGHWPEVNVLLPSDRIDPFGGVPDYNARVRVAKASPAGV